MSILQFENACLIQLLKVPIAAHKHAQKKICRLKFLIELHYVDNQCVSDYEVRTHTHTQRDTQTTYLCPLEMEKTNIQSALTYTRCCCTE